MSHPEGQAGRETYELRIRGVLGPLLLAALPHAAVSLEPRHTLVLTNEDGPEPVHVLHVVERLVDSGVELDSIRRTSPPAGPSPSEGCPADDRSAPPAQPA